MPGAALNPLNVGELPLDWWRNYRARVIEIVEAHKKAADRAAAPRRK